MSRPQQKAVAELHLEDSGGALKDGGRVDASQHVMRDEQHLVMDLVLNRGSSTPQILISALIPVHPPGLKPSLGALAVLLSLLGPVNADSLSPGSYTSFHVDFSQRLLTV